MHPNLVSRGIFCRKKLMYWFLVWGLIAKQDYSTTSILTTNLLLRYWLRQYACTISSIFITSDCHKVYPRCQLVIKEVMSRKMDLQAEKENGHHVVFMMIVWGFIIFYWIVFLFSTEIRIVNRWFYNKW